MAKSCRPDAGAAMEPPAWRVTGKKDGAPRAAKVRDGASAALAGAEARVGGGRVLTMGA